MDPVVLGPAGRIIHQPGLVHALSPNKNLSENTQVAELSVVWFNGSRLIRIITYLNMETG